MKTDASSDDVLDALAAVLRDFGRFAFDLDRQDARRTATLFDQWAQHVVAGIEPPGGAGRTSGKRDYPALRRAFRQHRETEQSEVTQMQESLREVVWAFVGGLNRLVTEDAADDAKVTATLSQLAFRLGKSSPLEIRSVALEAVSQVQAVFEARRARQRSQMQALAERLDALGSQLETARRESTTDALTQLYNRRAFDEQLARTVELAGLRVGGAGLLLVDIDFFKRVNDTHGHPAGDAVLVAVAQACVRAFKRKGDFVARYGGEEIAVLLRELDEAELLLAAERLRAQVETLEVRHGDARLRVTVSIGAAPWVRGEAPAAWLSRADQALYAAKHQGRNRVVTAAAPQPRAA